MSEWITTVNGLIALITGLCGLIGTGIGTYFAIRNWVKALKEKNAKDIWNMIITAADAAMKEVEKSTMDGATKKETVINSVKATLAAAGIDISDFIDQLANYIDTTIAFVNDMSKKPKTTKSTK